MVVNGVFHFAGQCRLHTHNYREIFKRECKSQLSISSGGTSKHEETCSGFRPISIRKIFEHRMLESPPNISKSNESNFEKDVTFLT